VQSRCSLCLGAEAREQRRAKRERTGDTAEAKAERRKQEKDYDAEEMKKRVGNPA